MAVGDEALDLRDVAREVVDLSGGIALPAFGDGHAHPLQGGLEEAGAAGPRRDDGRGRRRRRPGLGREHPEAEWIVGGSYDPALAPGGRFDARWLDVVADRPVVLRAADYHTVWCNSEALRRAGVDAATPDPALGWIDRRDDGTPLGTLREWQALATSSRRRSRRRPPTAQAAALARGAARLAAAGVSWVQDAWVDLETGASTPTWRRRRAASCRSAPASRSGPTRCAGATRSGVRRRRGSGPTRRSARLVRARTVKFFADGVVEAGTAALLEPYVDDPHSHGMPVWTPAGARVGVRGVRRRGLPAAPARDRRRARSAARSTRWSTCRPRTGGATAGR